METLKSASVQKKRPVWAVLYFYQVYSAEEFLVKKRLKKHVNVQTMWACKIKNTQELYCILFLFFFLIWRWFILYEMYQSMILAINACNVSLKLIKKWPVNEDSYASVNTAGHSSMWNYHGNNKGGPCTWKNPFSLFLKHRWSCTWMKMACTFTF